MVYKYSLCLNTLNYWLFKSQGQRRGGSIFEPVFDAFISMAENDLQSVYISSHGQHKFAILT